MGAPVKVNSSNTRPVTSVLVKKAGDPNVEREQLNRILSNLKESIDLLTARINTLEEL